MAFAASVALACASCRPATDEAIVFSYSDAFDMDYSIRYFIVRRGEVVVVDDRDYCVVKSDEASAFLDNLRSSRGAKGLSPINGSFVLYEGKKITRGNWETIRFLVDVRLIAPAHSGCWVRHRPFLRRGPERSDSTPTVGAR